MYTTYIGKKFLKIYNKEKRTNLTAKDFFDEVMFPVFFDHEKEFMNVANSPFAQITSSLGQNRARLRNINKKENKTDKDNDKIKELQENIHKLESPLGRIEALKKLHEKIQDRNYDGSTTIGFSAANDEGTSSGQITSLYYPFDEDDIYAS